MTCVMETGQSASQSLSAYGTARSTISGTPLDSLELRKIDAYRRACTEGGRLSRTVSFPPFGSDYRASGLLLHVTSLPSDYGIGDVGPARAVASCHQPGLARSSAPRRLRMASRTDKGFEPQRGTEETQ
jgi:hypothetical protein